MIVNGVWLPKIPKDVLAEYPYAILLHITLSSTSGDVIYILIFGSTPFVQVSASLIGAISDNIFSSGAGYRLSALPGENEWTNGTELENGGVGGQLGEFAGDVYTLVWANHDVYTAVAVDESTGEITAGTEIYFPNSETEEEEPKPERVSIGRSLMDKIANEVQRLTGTTDQMNAVQIRKKLSAVKAGIKIGDVVLPAIPEDVLARYPYALICVMVYNNANIPFMFVYTTPFVLCPGSILGYSDGVDRLITETLAAEVYLVESNKWSHSNSLKGVQSLIATDSCVPVWANHDIYTVTGIDTSEEKFVLGTEIYFSERQNFNGVWLPKIPEDVLAEYPYALIVNIERVDSDGTESEYLMLFCSTSEVIYAHTDITDFQSVIVAPVGGQSYLWTNNIWSVDEYLDALVFPTDNPMNSGDATFAYTILWSSHDIYEATEFDIGTFEYALGTDLYFPPLPAIDSERVSIGYDLFNDIVEQIQRLSNNEEKMDALRAYWKLTTVV